MKISVRFDGSIYGAIRSHSFLSRPIQSTSHTCNGPAELPARVTAPSAELENRPNSSTHVLNFFSFQIPRTFYSTIVESQSPPYTPGSRRWLHANSFERQLSVFPSLPAPRRTTEELLDLVGDYDDATVEGQLEFLKDPYMRRYAPPDTPELRISEHYHEVIAPLPENVQKGEPEEQEIVTKLRTAVFARLLRPHSVDNDTIYDLYHALPAPRMTYLTARLRHALLAVLGVAERKNAKSMLRYFAVVADVKNCGFALTKIEHNTAISFASRYVGKSTETEAEAALHLWREMEHGAGMKGDEFTFNILFDVASKAGKFALAEMIYQEMNVRGFHFNRYHHVSLIQFFGLKMDASGVRAAYREMVLHGEVIDTLVLNCVIASLLRCGEEAAVERIYKKMKVSDERSKLIPHRDYAFNKMVTRVLVMFGKIGRHHPGMRPGFQSIGMVSPDVATYRILLNHFGVRLGQMPKVAQFLDEMKWFRIPLHGAIFIALFKAFSIHGGGINGKEAWSAQRLANVWDAFLDAYDGGAEGLYINTWMAMWILRAFARSTRSRERILHVYEELKLRWEADTRTDSFMLEFLQQLLSQYHLGTGPKDSLQ